MILRFDVNNEQKFIYGDNIMTSSYTAGAINTSTSNSFGFGACVSRGFDCSITNYGDEWYTNYSFEGKEFKLFHGDVGDTRVITTFIVDSAVKRNGLITLSCTDRMQKLNVKFGGGSFPMTVYGLFTTICNQCGITTNVISSDLICGNMALKNGDGCEDKTCRSILSAIAEISGGFFVFGMNSSLEFRKFEFNASSNEYKADEIRTLTWEDMETKRNGVVIASGSTEYKFGDTDNAYFIDNNMLIPYLSEENINTIGNTIYNNNICSFHAGSFEAMTNKYIDVGNLITVTNNDGDVFKMVVGELTIKDTYVETITSVGDKKGETSDNTYSSYTSSNETTDYGGKVKIGYIRNNLRFDCYGGSYVVCGKIFESLNKYSKIHGFVEAQFKATSGYTLNFELYANDLLISSFPYYVTNDNETTFAFPCYLDIPNSTTGEYILKVKVPDNCHFTCDTSAITFSWVAYGVDVEDTVFEDKYIVDRLNKLKMSSLMCESVNFRSLSDSLEGSGCDINIEELTPSEYGPWDISLNRDNSVIATLYTNGLLYIVGQNDDIESNVMIDSADFYGWANGSNGKVASNMIKKINFKNVYNIGSNFLTHGIDYYSNLEEVKLSSNFQEIGGSLFKSYLNESTILSIYFEGDASGGISYAKKIGDNAFKNCTNFKQHNLYFDYAEKNINPSTGGEYISGGFDFGYSSDVFNGCTNLTGQIIFRATDFGGTYGGTSIFAGSGVSSIVIEEVIYTVNDEGEYTIKPIHFSSNFAYGCTSLKYVMCCGAETAYPYEEEITDFTFPQDMEYMFIGDKAFYNTAIDVVYMPGITEITGSTFVNVRLNYCSGVTAKVFTKDAGNDCKLILKDTIIHNEEKVKEAFTDFGISDVTGYILEE